MNCGPIVKELLLVFERFAKTQSGAGAESWHSADLADKNFPMDTVTFCRGKHHRVLLMMFKEAEQGHGSLIGILSSTRVRQMLANPQHHFLLQNTVYFQPDAIPAIAALLLFLDASDGRVNVGGGAPSLNRYVSLLFLATWVQADANNSLPFSTMDGCDGTDAYRLLFGFVSSSASNFRIAEKALNPRQLLFLDPVHLDDMWGARKVTSVHGTPMYLRVPVTNYDPGLVPAQRAFLSAFLAFCASSDGDRYPFSYAACRLPAPAFQGPHFSYGLTQSAQQTVWTTILVFQRLDFNGTARIPIELVRMVLAFCVRIFDAPVYNAAAPHNTESDSDTDYDDI